MPNSLRFRKAQFFILSAFAIVMILYFISKWIQPATIIDTSKIVLMEEAFIFNNVVEKAIETVRTSRSCEELIYNLDEFKIFVEKFFGERGKWILYSQLSSPCKLPNEEEIPTAVVFNITLITPEMELNKYFVETWKPS